jgi:AcrR family transcriptional regulator
MARTDKNFGERKAEIIHAATQVFVKNGYEGTTNRLIAEEMKQKGGNFSPQLIYHYFESKEALFTAVMQQAAGLEDVGTHIRASMHLQPEQFLQVVASIYMNLMRDRVIASLFQINLIEGFKKPEITQLVAHVIVSAFVIPTNEYLYAMMEQGKLRRCHTGVILTQFFGTMTSLMIPIVRESQRIAPNPPMHRNQFIKEMVSNLLFGLSTEKK